MTRAERVALAAIGTPFRRHGRDADGLDCVGLVLRAAGLADVTGYPARLSPAAAAARVDASGLKRCSAPRPGAIALYETAPGQAHLAVLTADGIVHADAMLRRVVARPGPPPWPLIAAWTTGED